MCVTGLEEDDIELFESNHKLLQSKNYSEQNS